MFRTGDKVRATRTIGDRVPEGTRGTVVRIGDTTELSPFEYRVSFRDYPFFPGSTDPEDVNWPVMTNEIEKEK